MIFKSLDSLKEFLQTNLNQKKSDLLLKNAIKHDNKIYKKFGKKTIISYEVKISNNTNNPFNIYHEFCSSKSKLKLSKDRYYEAYWLETNNKNFSTYTSYSLKKTYDILNTDNTSYVCTYDECHEYNLYFSYEEIFKILNKKDIQKIDNLFCNYIKHFININKSYALREMKVPSVCEKSNALLLFI